MDFLKKQQHLFLETSYFVNVLDVHKSPFWNDFCPSTLDYLAS